MTGSASHDKLTKPLLLCHLDKPSLHKYDHPTNLRHAQSPRPIAKHANGRRADSLRRLH